MIDLATLEAWFVTGSQHLYGSETLKAVEQHSTTIARALSSSLIPVKIVAKPVMTSSESIQQLCLDANSSKNCIGLIPWMHTFSPARMWIGGLRSLNKPYLHLHTQFNEELPWPTIDMNFMNLNQSAHGDREYGFIGARMRPPRKVVVGSWRDTSIHSEIAVWARAACAWQDAQHLKIARLGDNMRNVAVTEGDKVDAQIRLRYSVNGYGVGELVRFIHEVKDAEIERLTVEYDETYAVAESLRPNGNQRKALHEAARIELGLRHFLLESNSNAFTDTFEDLHGLAQLPGIAVQRLMADGYGFGAEGDWKTAALVRLVTVMSAGLDGGTSFMEDYTYNLGAEEPQVLGAHMLEVCPSIASDQPTCEIHPLTIGGRADPVRLVFTAPPGPGLVVGLVDLGTRLRLVANEVDVVAPEAELPRLPVAHAVWVPRPGLATAAESWLLAGGPHHTCFTQAVTIEAVEDLAEIAGVELVAIGSDTTASGFRRELRWNEAYHHLAGGL